MPLITVLRNDVRQSAAPQYERLIRFIAERARQDQDTFHWGGRVTTGAEGRAISFVTTVEGFAELAAREQPDDMVRRLFGEGDGNALIEALGEGVERSSYTVATIREDLSTQAAPPEEPQLALVTRLRATNQGALGVAELIRKVGEAAAKVDEQRRTLVLQTLIGDLRNYAVVQFVADPAQLDQQSPVPELLMQAYGEEEGEKIFREGTQCIEHAETELSVPRPDLSNQA
ncbi:MAG: hypothetical protein OEP95_09520 [Myxococcales bacterium]|nr:hypothetical protein [Myxococcales bacterium]